MKTHQEAKHREKINMLPEGQKIIHLCKFEIKKIFCKDWSKSGSNRRPSDLQSDALPPELLLLLLMLYAGLPAVAVTILYSGHWIVLRGWHSLHISDVLFGGQETKYIHSH